MIKKLDLYLLRHFFISLIVVTLAIGLMIIVINMVEQLKDFIDHDVPLLRVAEYYLYFGGWVVKAFMPMFVMLATLFSVSMLARRLEILAMAGSGRSLYRIALPLFVVGLLISAGHFYYNEYIFPPANKERVEIKEFTIKRHSRRSFTSVRNVYRQISPGKFYTVGKFNVDRMEGVDLKLYETDGKKLTKIILADKVMYLDNYWLARDGFMRIFRGSGGETYINFDSLLLPQIEDVPKDLAKRIGKPEDMSLDELSQYIDLMKRTGGPYLREMIDLKIKYAFPLTSLIVILVCVPFAANPRRGGIAVSFAVGAAIALGYFVLFRVMQSAGYNEKIPQDLAVWGINGLFFVIGITSMIFTRK